MLERRSEHVERVTDAEDRIGRLAVDESHARRIRGAGRVERRHETGVRILQRAQTAHVLLGGELGRHAAQQVGRDLDGVAVRAHGRIRARLVEIARAVPRALQDPRGLGTRAIRERRDAGREIARRCRGLHAPLSNARRVAGDDGARGHVLRDDGSGGDHRTVADRDAVDDHDVRAHPHVVADRDALRREGLLVDGGVRILHRVVEREDRRVGADAHGVAERHLAAHDRERVDGAVRARDERARDVGVARDVRAVAEFHAIHLHRRDLRHEASLGDRDLGVQPHRLGLQPDLSLLLVGGRVVPEEPGRVVEVVLVERRGRHRHPFRPPLRRSSRQKRCSHSTSARSGITEIAAPVIVSV
jgi:hypothetical protein